MTDDVAWPQSVLESSRDACVHETASKDRSLSPIPRNDRGPCREADASELYHGRRSFRVAPSTLLGRAWSVLWRRIRNCERAFSEELTTRTAVRAWADVSIRERCFRVRGSRKRICVLGTCKRSDDGMNGRQPPPESHETRSVGQSDEVVGRAMCTEANRGAEAIAGAGLKGNCKVCFVAFRRL